MKPIAITLLASVLLTALLLPLTALEPGQEVSAHHAVLYEPVTGTYLMEKNSHVRAPMASTTKIMTALVAIEAGDLDRKITIPREACGIEGSSIYMTEGEVLTLRELLYALLLQSANDAATAIAIAVGGSVEGFADLMNRKAEALGLSDTHFTNPHGLDHEDHYTTAYDLAKIAAAAMELSEFSEIVSTVKHTIPHGNDGDVRVLVNHNKLLRLYREAVGVKTGFTKKSGRCLVGAAERNGLTLITVTLDAPNDWNDHIRLFEWGFSKMENRLLADAGAYRVALPVWGKDGETVFCVNPEPIYAILPKDAPEPEAIPDLPHYLPPKEKAGKAVGSVRFVYGGKTVAESTLITETSQ